MTLGLSLFDVDPAATPAAGSDAPTDPPDADPVPELGPWHSAWWAPHADAHDLADLDADATSTDEWRRPVDPRFCLDCHRVYDATDRRAYGGPDPDAENARLAATEPEAERALFCWHCAATRRRRSEPGDGPWAHRSAADGHYLGRPDRFGRTHHDRAAWSTMTTRTTTSAAGIIAAAAAALDGPAIADHHRWTGSACQPLCACDWCQASPRAHSAEHGTRTACPHHTGPHAETGHRCGPDCPPQVPYLIHPPRTLDPRRDREATERADRAIAARLARLADTAEAARLADPIPDADAGTLF